MSGPVDDDNTMLVSGAYECVAENDIGVGTSEPLEVRVLCKLLSIIRYIELSTNRREVSQCPDKPPTSVLIDSEM